MEIIKYEHHGVVVSVQKHLQGKHREHCLCFQGCKFFKPDTVQNCSIAATLYALDCLIGMTTPVWECPKFEK